MTFQSTLIRKDPTDPLLRAMFTARKQVFVDLLKWDVPVLSGQYEIDQFDTSDATYLVIADEHGNHRASTRLLPTAERHILGELFPALCEGPVPSAHDILEITRFCIDLRLRRSDRLAVRNELVSALADFALAQGIARYTAVASRSWFEKIRHFGWRCRALGPVTTFGSEQLVALEIEIDAATPDNLKEKGIYRSRSFVVSGAALEQTS